MSRKVFLIIIGVLILVILGSLIYLLFFSSPPQKLPPPPSASVPVAPPQVTAPAQENGQTIVPEVSKVTQIVENRVLSFALKGNEIVYYDVDQGKFFRSLQDGKEAVPYSDSVFTNVSEVIWSPDKTQVILGFGNGDHYHFNVGTGQSTKLMPAASRISWFADGAKIVYEWQENEGERQLIIADADGNNWEKIKDLGYAKVLAGSSPQLNGPVAMLQNYAYGTERSVYLVYKDGAAGVPIRLEGYGEKAKWSRDGGRLLYEAVSAENYEQYLWVVDLTGTNNYNLGIKSFIEKCVWNKTSEKLYCAVPSEPLGAQASVDDESVDNFWEINTKTGEKRKLYDESESDARFDATNLWLSSTEDKLYFTDAGNGVYALRLD